MGILINCEVLRAYCLGPSTVVQGLVEMSGRSGYNLSVRKRRRNADVSEIKVSLSAGVYFIAERFGSPNLIPQRIASKVAHYTTALNEEEVPCTTGTCPCLERDSESPPA